MSYGSHAYGSAPYGSNAEAGATTVALATVTYDLSPQTLSTEVTVDLATVTYDLDPQPLTLVEAAQVSLATVTYDLSPQALATQVTVDLATVEYGLEPQPFVTETPYDLATVVYDLSPQEVTVVTPRVDVTAWTEDQSLGTGGVCEWVIEVELEYPDPTPESGWQPIRTNKVTWPTITVDANGRPVSAV